MSRWKKVSLAILAVIFLLLGTVVFLVGTTPGLHILFKAANRWVPGLEITKVDGGWRNLTISGVRYQQPSVDVNAGEVKLAVSLGCLWNSRFCINNLSLKDINVVVDSTKMPPSAPTKQTDNGPLNLSTPYPIILHRVALNNVTLKLDTTAVSLASFSSGMSWEKRNLTLTPTTLEGLLITLPKTAQVVKQEVVEPKITHPQPASAPLGETLKQLFAKPVLPEMAAVNLPLNLNIQSFQATHLQLTGDTDVLVNSLLLKVSSIDGNMKLETLDVDSSQGQVKASGTALLKDNWPVDLKLNATLNIAPLSGEKLKMQVGGALRDQLKVAMNLSGPVNMDINAKTRLAEAGLPLSLKLASQQLSWPFSGKKQYQADNVQLTFDGKMTDYTLAFKGAVSGEQIPPATITLNGKGNEQQLNLDKLRIAVLQGNTDLKAILDWSQAISWRAELSLAGINTAHQYPDWPAKLDGTVKTTGSLYGGTWQVNVPELKLAGNVKQNKVNVNGQFKGNSYMQWQIPGLNVELGRNHLDVKGEVGEKALALNVNIDAPSMDNALPGLGGRAKGTLNLRGDIKAPQLLADMTVEGLRWQELSIAQVLLKGEVTSTDQIAGNLNLRVERVTQPGVNIPLVTLEAKGTEKQHQLQLRIQGEPVSGQLNLAGGFDRATQRWQGNLSQTRFDTPVGPWALNRALTLDYRNQEQTITIGPHCWTNPNAQLCVPQPINAGPKGRAVVNLNRFDLAMLKPLMPQTLEARGSFTGRADVSWDSTAKGLPQGQVTLKGQGVKITQRVDNNPISVVFDTLNLDAELKNNRAQLGWLMKVAHNGQLDGQVQVSDPQGQRNLAGTVNLRNFDLSIANALFSRGEKVAGKLNSSLRLGGNIERPQVFGQLQFSDTSIGANFMPFVMQPSHVTVSFNGTSSTLQGVVRTQQGQIVLNGDADWKDLNGWRARVAAKGDKVRITVPPIVRLDVSPDVEFIATPSLYTLNGQVDIPWARIIVQQVPESSVGVSSDEVLLDKNLQPIKTQTAAIPINSDLKIHVGNDVRLEAFGLKARLAGDLQVKQDDQGLGLNGQINIPLGRFHAYGQDLIVRKGELLFSGPPDQPLLNLEAIRNPESTENDVVAGVRVTGSTDEPKVEIFSDPVMSQQEALSYLLRGQGLDSSSDNGNAMTSALVGLGVAQSGQVMGKIGETFGVSNLALDTAGVGDSSQVVVSGYVLPGLQVKYGVGIFDSLATLTLRYRLMPKLYLEAVSGLDQALDLLYQFEF